MKDILKKYYQLLLEDKKYLNKYILNKTSEDEKIQFIQYQIQEGFIWRNVNSYTELENIVHSKNSINLARIGDWYIDEMSKLLEYYLNINFRELEDEEIESILAEDNLQRILGEKETPEQLKKAIILESKSNEICDELYKYLKQEAQNSEQMESI